MSFISSNLDIDRNTRLANYKQQHGRQLYNIQMHVDAILACISISIPRTHVTCHMQQFIHHKLATFYSSQIRRPYNSNGILHSISNKHVHHNTSANRTSMCKLYTNSNGMKTNFTPESPLTSAGMLEPLIGFNQKTITTEHMFHVVFPMK